MMAPSHVAVGLATWAVTAPILSQPTFAPIPLALVVLGSLLPDIDHPNSWVGRRMRPLSSVIAALLGHRGVTHSLVAVALLLVVLLRPGSRPDLVLPLALGYISHLAADALTPRGLRLFWPMRRTVGIPLCATGSPAEGVVVALLLGLAWWSWSHPLFRPVAPAQVPVSRGQSSAPVAAKRPPTSSAAADGTIRRPPFAGAGRPRPPPA